MRTNVRNLELHWYRYKYYISAYDCIIVYWLEISVRTWNLCFDSECLRRSIVNLTKLYNFVLTCLKNAIQTYTAIRTAFIEDLDANVILEIPEELPWLRLLQFLPNEERHGDSFPHDQLHLWHMLRATQEQIGMSTRLSSLKMFDINYLFNFMKFAYTLRANAYILCVCSRTQMRTTISWQRWWRWQRWPRPAFSSRTSTAAVGFEFTQISSSGEKEDQGGAWDCRYEYY